MENVSEVLLHELQLHELFVPRQIQINEVL